MNKKMKKIGTFMVIGVMAATLSGCRLAKKEADETAKQKLYGAYAVVGDKDLPDDKIIGTKDKKGFVHFKKLKGYFLYTYKPQKDTISMDGDPQLMKFSMESKTEADDEKMNAKEKEKVVSATMYLQKKKVWKQQAFIRYMNEKMVHIR